MEKVRAKFKCISERKFEGWTANRDDAKPFFYDYKFTAVFNGGEENKKFFAATPSGEISLTTVASSMFTPGREYYIDFTEAEF